MNRSEIVNALINNHTQFIRTLQAMPAEEVKRSMNGKWSPAQLLDHLVRSVSPVRLAFSLPSFVLKWKFGTANRPSRTYEALVEKYHAKLSEGGKASGSFIPGGNIDVKAHSDKLMNVVHSLCTKIGSYSEDQLDRYILPHPLLGKLTLREMLYFTAYHVDHHHAQITSRNIA
jgi:hypothetical protein